MIVCIISYELWAQNKCTSVNRGVKGVYRNECIDGKNWQRNKII